ncbi:heterodisulfide reductase-related iron-sulfur binding cluster [Janibacter sp. GS2]|uniref:heterodisulfide reductase-related iron-sulfur binding cluster n=1 Tax=Janibacter sp. GS2 TaxID=3442646 RepID=UPI003EB9A167
MSALQIVAIVIGVGITIVGWGLLARVVKHFVTLFKLGKPTPEGERTSQPGARTTTLLREFLGHTRMSRLPVVAIAHWVTMISFGVLFLTLVQATVQLFDPHFVLPLIGSFFLYEWITEFFAMTGIVTILMLMAIRQKNHPRSAKGEEGRSSRFYGSTFWQAYYVELTILGVGICIALLRGFEYALLSNTGDSEHASLLHFPLTAWLGSLFEGMSVGALETAIIVVALIKLVISYAWMITISLTPTMGVAWHRFLAFFNIYFKRHADGRTSLGELQPMMVDGKPFSMEVMEDMDEDSTLGVGQVEDFTWKGLLDFSTCTECGRCQSQCPAWNTEKPLSPKMMIMALRDHAQAKAPYLAAANDVSGTISSVGGARAQTASGAVALADGTKGADAEGSVATAEPDAINWGEMALVGQTGYDPDHPLSAYNPHGPDAVIDEDVLWSCTTCGACVEQCPVDIEHVDHIVDMRRYQNLIASAFPSELNGLFKKLESKGNPWGMGAKARMDWAKDLPFTVKVLGEDVESADDVDYLFWVGCAGAYEDRAKKTTRAVAELFDHAGVDFAVLGNGETCTGDSARRAGNEVLFQMLAEQNVETLNEVGATKIVVTCAHCFNTIKNEYPQLGGHYEVLHHTQLLNRLVREKKIAPVNRPESPRKSSLKDVASTAPSVTYHDPCYLGRHNNVYAPPRELISALPGVELKEMERSKEKSFCCGAGGARMWMEEQLGSRINLNRTEEAIATGADRIAVGCPFCRVMLSDGLTAKQSEGASEEIEVVDVAQMLLASVKETATTAKEAKTESEEQAEAEPKTAVPAPTEGQDAKGATPEPPSEAETAATAEAVEEAGEDPKAVEGKETVANKNAAPSWETGTSTSAAPEEPKDEAPAAEATPADKNAAPSWETGSAAAKNAAPSWETGAPAATAPAATEEPTNEEPKDEGPATTDDSTAAKNAAPSWETGAPAATAPAATEEPTNEEPKDEGPATTDDSTAAKNAAPSWETGAPAATAPAATEEATSEEATTAPAKDDTNEAPAEDTSSVQATDTTSEPAATTEVPSSTGDSDLAAKNAAPSWESGAPAATQAPATQEPEAAPKESTDKESTDQESTEPTEDDTNEAPAEDTSSVQATDTTSEPAATTEVPSSTGDSDLAAKNAAPSWESGAPAATQAPATQEPEAAPKESTDKESTDQESTDPTEDDTNEARAEDTSSVQATDTTSEPAATTEVPSSTGDSDLAAKNAAPSWESGAPAATQAPATQESEAEPEAATEPESDTAPEPQQEQAEPAAATEQTPEADAAPEEAASTEESTPPAASDSDQSDLAKKNANPSWE